MKKNPKQIILHPINKAEKKRIISRISTVIAEMIEDEVETINDEIKLGIEADRWNTENEANKKTITNLRSYITMEINKIGTIDKTVNIDNLQKSERLKVLKEIKLKLQ